MGTRVTSVEAVHIEKRFLFWPIKCSAKVRLDSDRDPANPHLVAVHARTPRVLHASLPDVALAVDHSDEAKRRHRGGSTYAINCETLARNRIDYLKGRGVTFEVVE